jgi:hypothetical protein
LSFAIRLFDCRPDHIIDAGHYKDIYHYKSACRCLNLKRHLKRGGIEEGLKTILAIILAFPSSATCLLSRASYFSSISFSSRPREIFYFFAAIIIAFFQSNKKNQTKRKRKKKLSLINRADKVAMIGANVLVIIEINGKYFIYNSQPDKL